MSDLEENLADIIRENKKDFPSNITRKIIDYLSKEGYGKMVEDKSIATARFEIFKHPQTEEILYRPANPNKYYKFEAVK